MKEMIMVIEENKCGIVAFLSEEIYGESIQWI